MRTAAIGALLALLLLGSAAAQSDPTVTEWEGEYGEDAYDGEGYEGGYTTFYEEDYEEEGGYLDYTEYDPTEYDPDYDEEDPLVCLADSPRVPEAQLLSESCELVISGVDEQLDLLEGGLDGVYVLNGTTCGYPTYYRTEATGGNRVLWYDDHFEDWTLSVANSLHHRRGLIGHSSALGPYYQPQSLPTNIWSMLREHRTIAHHDDPSSGYVDVQLDINCHSPGVSTLGAASTSSMSPATIGAIAGGVAGVLLATVIFAVGIVVYKRRQSRAAAKYMKDDKLADGPELTPRTLEGQALTSSSPALIAAQVTV